MSYTLRGRLESRLAALLPLVAGRRACSRRLMHRWWPVEAAALMVGVGLALDTPALPPAASATSPAGRRCRSVRSSSALLLGLMRLLGVERAASAGARALRRRLAARAAPRPCGLSAAAARLRRGRAASSDGSARVRRSSSASRSPRPAAPPTRSAAAGRPPRRRRPPGPARDHAARGPRRRAPGAVVRGGIVVRANDVTIKNVSVVGGENGITVDGVHGTVLDGVSVSGAKLDGIHVASRGVVIKNCSVDMHGNPLGQGIDISYNMGMGMSMVEGCTVVGGMEGITTHSLDDRDRARPCQRHRAARHLGHRDVDGHGHGQRGDRRARHRHLLQRPLDLHDRAQHGRRHAPRHRLRQPDAQGFGVLASFQSLAELRGNHLASNPVPMGAVINSEIAPTH